MLTAKAFKGNPEVLKWAFRDLPDVDTALSLVPGRTACIQAGGNYGVYPKHLAAIFQTVYCFEPAPDLFPILLENAAAPNVVMIQAALGETRELVSMGRKRRGIKPNFHEGTTHVIGPGTIPTLRIDDLNLPVCDFLSLDLEGWEYYALRGASETLQRCRPVVMVEVNQNCEFVGLTPQAVRDVLIGHGYRLFKRVRSDEIFMPEARCR